MKKKEIFSDDELTAYLDGELEHAAFDKISLGLSHDDELRNRLALLDIDRAKIAHAFECLSSQSPHAPAFLNDAHNPGKWRGIYSVMTAACVVLAFSIFSFNIITSRNTTDDWLEYVAIYQALYTDKTLSNINQTDPKKLVELRRASKVLGKNFTLTILKSIDNLDYKRAQILGYKGEALIQLAFLSQDKSPVALCIMRSRKNTYQDIKVQERQGMSSATWQKENYAYLLIGGNDPALIKKSATHLLARL